MEVNATPQLFHPREKQPVPLVRASGWVSGAAGWVRKIQPAPGIELRSVQPTRNMRGAYNNRHLHLSLSNFSFNSKGNFRPRSGHEREVEYRYSCILSLSSVLDRGGMSKPRLGRFTPDKRPCTHI